MGRQGRYLSQQEIDRIVWLLLMTELTFMEIGERMSCTRATVAAINRKRQVRFYSGLKKRWSLDPSPVQQSSREVA
jgi:hypothetical protein